MELDMGGGDPTLLDIVVGHVKSGRGRQAAPLELSVVRTWSRMIWLESTTRPLTV